MAGGAADPSMMGTAERRALELHDHYQRGLYARTQKAISGGWLISDPAVDDPEWNHVGRIDFDPEVGLAGDPIDAFLARSRAAMAERSRPFVLAVDPWTRPANLAEELESRGWQRVFSHRWAFFRGESPSIDSSNALVLRTVRDHDSLDAFLKVFFAAFWGVGEAADPAHTEAIRQSFECPPPDCEVIHHLGLFKGRAVAVGTSIHGLGGSGFYNLGVHPEARGRGFGARLGAERLRAAFARGSETIFLQTEEDPVARWGASLGWTPGFTVDGWKER